MNDKPIRVQRKRTKGFKLLENTICVTRPNKWGNPFKATSADGGAAHAVAQYTDWIREEISSGRLNLAEIRGKNLACFCPIGPECHADVLLKLANP